MSTYNIGSKAMEPYNKILRHYFLRAATVPISDECVAFTSVNGILI